jgi:putative oxidoreductase
MILRILHWLSRSILGGIFIYSGYIKTQNWLQFVGAINGYKLFSDNNDWLVWKIADYFPWFEIALGLSLLLLIKRKIRYAAVVATALMLFFIILLTITYFRGIEANCGCFSFDDRISPKTIARDSLMLLPALYLLAEPLIRKRLQNKNPDSGTQNPDPAEQ